MILVDIRRSIEDSDRAILAAMYDQGVACVVVATKVDKCNERERGEGMEVRTGKYTGKGGWEWGGRNERLKR